MGNYSKETLLILSICILFSVFPNLVLAKESSLQSVVDQKISKMTTQEKVGQLFMVGFPQKEFTTSLEAFIRKYKPGSFLLFKRNISSVDQIRKLNSSLYKSSFKNTKLPPFIAIDQEGGNVSRLPIFPAPPSALAIGSTKSPLLAEGMGLETGKFLRDVGFNMNLAPVLDVSDPHTMSFIGARSFGADPALVAQLGVAYSQGLLKAHVIPTAKHFPGTGSLTGDPHHSVVHNESSLESLQNSDLKPYESYVKLGSNIAVMLSHLIYPALDESREPASFSSKISTDLLRGQMKYKGLVITDDLQMQGSRQLLRPEEAALRAVLAGADIIMLTWSIDDQGKAFSHLLNAAQSGQLPEELLDQKVRRILMAKAFVNSYKTNTTRGVQGTGFRLTSRDYSDIEAKILDQNLKTSLSNEASVSLAPTEPRRPASVGRICVIAPTKTFISSFKKHARTPFESKLVSENVTAAQAQSWIKKQRCSLTISAVTGKKTAGVLESFPDEEKRKIVIVNLASPGLIKDSRAFPKVIQLYFSHANSGKKIAQHLHEILRDLNFKIASK